ncbi:hypothetical protein EUX98_g4835 [Antrodiella citrinella]|uniref:Uncharacterized protein n=1 Tax=Antrodiella citrinella TaxID=2447956 RepID=A0A4S4N0Y6_9APHY|nr:hypothetical protein EUX98_g4835 [Antrodiella citrinella]
MAHRAHMQEHSIVLAPIISTGHLGTVPLAATTVATMISNVTGYGVISGLTGALDHVLDPGSPASLFTGFWCICTSFVLLVTFIPMTMMWSSIERLLVSLRQSPDMVQLTMLNLHLTALSIPAFAAYEVLKRYLNSKGLGSVHTRLTTLAATLNATLNYVLVHGPSSVRLGFPGAPIATAACYNFVAVSTALYILLRPCAIQIQAVTTEMNKPDKPSMLRGLGVVMFLGLGGVARTAATSWSKDVIGFSTSVFVHQHAMLVLHLKSPQSRTCFVSDSGSPDCYDVVSVSSAKCYWRMFSTLEHLLSTGCVGRAKLAIVAASLVTVGAALGMCNILYWYCDSWSRIITNDPGKSLLYTSFTAPNI